jgi:hypothetical protein
LWDLLAGIFGAASACFLALPTWRDVKAKKTVSLVGMFVSAIKPRGKSVIEEVYSDAIDMATRFRAEDRKALIGGLALVALAFLVPLFGKIMAALGASLSVCIDRPWPIIG